MRLFIISFASELARGNLNVSSCVCVWMQILEGCQGGNYEFHNRQLMAILRWIPALANNFQDYKFQRIKEGFPDVDIYGLVLWTVLALKLCSESLLTFNRRSNRWNTLVHTVGKKSHSGRFQALKGELHCLGMRLPESSDT